jgi:hypothetical protein
VSETHLVVFVVDNETLESGSVLLQGQVKLETSSTYPVSRLTRPRVQIAYR